MTAIIRVPNRLDLESSIQFAKELRKILPAESCEFDFRRLNKVRPFGMLRTACAIRDYIAQYSHQTRFSMRHDLENNFNQRAMGYAAHMGFFQACGLDHGNAPGGDAGCNYVPITLMNSSELLSRFGNQGNIVESIAAQLAHQLLRESSSAVFTAVAYSFCEMIRNVVEHSEAETIGYCAQFWPTRNSVEIAILDNGIGLRTALRNNPHLTIVNDSDALKFALAPAFREMPSLV